MKIKITDSLDGIDPSMLVGFFSGWPQPPTQQTHLELLRKSDHVVLALDTEANCVVGFITAISDGVLTAYLPLLEVLPGYQHQGIGSMLLEKMLEKLNNLYAVDLICDEDLRGYYEKWGFKPARGMIIRKYDRQSG